ncbi:beta-lactamase family protein [Herbiconiux sp. VKM Ac-1786]|uniref:serine hydrolase domain-containing protein n=1 Tax=Herbiconiux sp. VKM Ac-1786 TaxID=2783824 RepID=UPI00188AA860|nr:serine hydrolase domain-containing protein [Herbiconiux sp. VKM Ac-1786]MBF4573453.1 beta-lactamase family protein [Herbiconiux sp. VKM Ac-1786]
MRWARGAAGVAVLVVGALVLTGCTAAAPAPPASGGAPTAAADAQAGAAGIRSIIEDKREEWGLRAVLVSATVKGRPVIREAFGESMTGVPATTGMHVRNGAVAISSVATVLLQLVEEGEVSLDDRLGTWLPEVPHADEVTLGQLAQMTAGYADYLWDPELLHLLEEDPFRQWTPEELAAYGTSKPLVYEPGTNWNYSHTDYLLLGLALEAITRKPVDQLIEERVIGPLGLTGTAAPGTAAIPDPVLHAYTAERREYLGVPDGVPFLEDSTFWNPSWTITRGAVQYSTLDDLLRTAEAVGTGELLSPELHAEQLNLDTRAFASPIDGCPACFPHSEIYTYGIGVVMMGDWVLQNPMFSGTAAVEAYLPGEDVALAVVVTFDESAFDGSGAVGNRATDLFRLLAAELAPQHAPPTRP